MPIFIGLASLKSRYSSSYQDFLAQIKSVRLAAGLTQQQVANALERPQSFVAKYESGERRLDVVEFIEVCEAIDVEPSTVINELLAMRRAYKTVRKRAK